MLTFSEYISEGLMNKAKCLKYAAVIKSMRNKIRDLKLASAKDFAGGSAEKDKKIAKILDKLQKEVDKKEKEGCS